MKNENLKKMTKGFTLAETLITLTILGVVAAITVPMLINKQMEAANRTKLKKAMAAYEKALNQMIVDNDIKGTITAVEGFRLTDNCSGSRPYFKAIKEIAGNNCRFQTADKVWWDIMDIEHPLISLKDEITDGNIATLKGNADSLDDDKTSFVMVGEIKDGIVRINDKGAVSSEDKNYVDKLYAFINKDGSGSAPSGGGENAVQSCSANDDREGCKLLRGDYSVCNSGNMYDGGCCKAKQANILSCSFNDLNMFDDDGNLISTEADIKKYDSTGTILLAECTGCEFDSNGNVNGFNSSGRLYDETGTKILIECEGQCRFDSNKNITYVADTIVNVYDEEGNVTFSCNKDCYFDEHKEEVIKCNNGVKYDDVSYPIGCL